MSKRDDKNLILLSLGIAMMWLPLHNAFYRYTIVGEGRTYWIVLLVVSLACVAFIVGRKQFAWWLAKRPKGVIIISSVTLATNALLFALPSLGLDAAIASPLRTLLIIYYEFTFVFLFFTWIRRLADIMYQVSIVRAVGYVGFAISLTCLLSNLSHDTIIYSVIVSTCLFFSGLCWQLCTYEAIDNQQFQRPLPTARSLYRWALLLAAFFAVSVLQAVMLAALGARADQAEYTAWIPNIGFVLLCIMFLGTISAAPSKGRRIRLRIRLVFSIIILIMTAYYMGILSLMAAPYALSEEGCLAVMAVVQRTLRIFIFLALIVICYQDSAAPSCTFGLLLLLAEVVHDLICYVIGPAFFDVFPFEASSFTVGAASVIALVLIACFAGFNLLRLQEWHQYLSLPNGSTDDKPFISTSGNESDQDTNDVPQNAPTRRQICEELGRENGLTEREVDVLYYLSLGYAAKKIADTLYVSPNTISTHSSRLYRKMDVHTRQDLMDIVNERLGTHEAEDSPVEVVAP